MMRFSQNFHRFFMKFVHNLYFFDIEDKVWIMTYGSYKIDEVGNKVYIPGSDFCMAISEKDGRVLRMWFY